MDLRTHTDFLPINDFKRIIFEDDSFIRPAVNPENGWYHSKTEKYYPSITAALSDLDGRQLLFKDK